MKCKVLGIEINRARPRAATGDGEEDYAREKRLMDRFLNWIRKNGKYFNDRDFLWNETRDICVSPTVPPTYDPHRVRSSTDLPDPSPSASRTGDLLCLLLRVQVSAVCFMRKRHVWSFKQHLNLYVQVRVGVAYVNSRRRASQKDGVASTAKDWDAIGRRPGSHGLPTLIGAIRRHAYPSEDDTN